MAQWYDELFRDRIRFGLKVTSVLYSEQSEHQKIEVLDTVQFGRVLVLDGVFMTSESDEHFYHEMLAQPAMTTAPAIRRVLLIGGGDGGTIREVLRHPEVERLTVVEIDGQVVEVSRKLLPAIGTAWDDPRLELIIGDGVAYARDSEVEPYDVILLDGCDPVGPSEGLFDVRTLRGVCGRAHPYFGTVPLYSAGMWTWTYATRTADPLAIVDERAARVEAFTKYYNREIHRAAFAVPNSLRG